MESVISGTVAVVQLSPAMAAAAEAGLCNLIATTLLAIAGHTCAMLSYTELRVTLHAHAPAPSAFVAVLQLVVCRSISTGVHVATSS